MFRDQKSRKNPNWKGGRTIHGGYVAIHKPDHPNAFPNGYVLEHRLVMEKYLGRYLNSNEHIHHKDGNKQNNDITNLMLVDNSEHTHIHWSTPKARHQVSQRIKKLRSIRFWSTKSALLI